ncbi:MAG: hypothetical protein DRH10_09020 [Deltaproteobacteria bacterium]|nr:MAG: hypothetical protein DRH10_09020 [Deltaproteobacteria bacterium]
MKPDDLLKLIKNRRTIRKYQNKPIPIKIINKIIEAGRWSSSIHGFQPWRFLVIRNDNLIEKISKVLIKKSKRIGAGTNILLSSSAETIGKAKVIVVVFDTKEFVDLANRFRKSYVKVARITGLSAISASIQNMILVAESLEIGSCWLDMPLFCEKQINKLLGVKDEQLVAILTLGYPAEEGKRSERKPIEETVRYIR